MGQTSWFNLSIVLALCLGSLTYGYIIAVITNTLGQPNFYTYFGLTTDVSDTALYNYTNRITGSMNGIFSAGGLFGAIFSAWLSESHGRKMTLLAATIISLIGGALQGGSVQIGMFLFARFFSGFGAGMLITVVPVFQAEVAPPASRGMLVSLNGVLIVVAYTLAGWIGVACYFAENVKLQWRLPLALQTLWPLLILAVIPWIPESPRWLLEQKRSDEAWKIVERLHHRSDDPTDSFAKKEFYQMSRQVEADEALAAGETWLSLFSKPSYRKRVICAFFMMYAGQASGNLVIANYSVSIYQRLGQTGAIPLILSAAYCSLSVFLNYICALLIDRVGRVTLLIFGLAGCLVCLCCECALIAVYLPSSNTGGLKAAVFFLFFYICFYGGCVDANTYVYCSEIFPTHIRPRGMALSMVTLYLTSTPFLQGAPTAFTTIGWKYYVVFIVLTAVNIPIIWFYFPETKGLSLEEINGQFGDEVIVYFTHVTDEENAKIEAAAFEAIDGNDTRFHQKEDNVTVNHQELATNVEKH
ncbi:hypothetical protein B7494_g4225 [Chlorociboria aeruginascens]|nr:hypothetical protein B7494_g4225 [Chlorociboria aeruginascens]